MRVASLNVFSCPLLRPLCAECFLARNRLQHAVVHPTRWAAPVRRFATSLDGQELPSEKQKLRVPETGRVSRFLPPKERLQYEIGVVRRIFGYGRSSDPQPRYGSLPAKFGKLIRKTYMHDIMFLAVDVDTKKGYDEIVPGQEFHVGVAIMDSRTLLAHVHATVAEADARDKMCRRKPKENATIKREERRRGIGESRLAFMARMDRLKAEKQEVGRESMEQHSLMDREYQRRLDEMIQCYQFNIGQSGYIQKAADRFLFGTAQSIMLAELKPRLEALVGNRDVVLVCHGGGESDLKMLQSLGVEIKVVAIIDTLKAAPPALNLLSPFSLQRLLITLGIKSGGLHAAGNDAYFSLRALMLLALVDALRQSKNDLKRAFGRIFKKGVFKASHAGPFSEAGSTITKSALPGPFETPDNGSFHGPFHEGFRKDESANLDFAWARTLRDLALSSTPTSMTKQQKDRLEEEALVQRQELRDKLAFQLVRKQQKAKRRAQQQTAEDTPPATDKSGFTKERTWLGESDRDLKQPTPKSTPQPDTDNQRAFA